MKRPFISLAIPLSLQIVFAGFIYAHSLSFAFGGNSKPASFNKPKKLPVSKNNLKVEISGFKKNILKTPQNISGAKYFTLKVKNGEKLGNIFSRTISFKSDSFPEIVNRVSGTGIYTVINNNP